MDNIAGAKRPRKQFTEESEAIGIADKPGKLTREDVTCPICWSILYEPTTLPCKHSFCIKCLKRHVEEASIHCPCCRCRLGIWSRRVSKSQTHLDEPLWNRIQAEFPKLVEARLKDLDSPDILEDEWSPLFEDHENTNPVRTIIDGTICTEPGEVRAELLQIQEEHEKDIERKRLLEEAASVELIRKMQEEEKNQRLTFNSSLEEEDFLFAKRLQSKLRKEDERFIAAAMPRRISSRIKRPVRRNLTEELDDVGNSSFDSFSSFSKTSRDSSFCEDQSPSRHTSAQAFKKRKKKPSCTVTSENVMENSPDICSKAYLLIPPKPVRKTPAFVAPAPVENFSVEFEAQAPVGKTYQVGEAEIIPGKENLEARSVPNLSFAELFNEADDKENLIDLTCSQEDPEINTTSQETSTSSNLSVCLNENGNDLVHQMTETMPSSSPVPPTPDKNFHSRIQEGMSIDMILNDSFNGLSPFGKVYNEVVLGEKEYECLILEGTALQAHKQKLEQEAQDRAFAKSLNSWLRLGLPSPGRSENMYRLRRSVRMETPVVGENNVD
ncbi:hypothetical protein Ocin01_03164 [Orchesella cincta]|uniref:RING-type E3 ubiquitin transferase n=1 Tax=Orchesella cincta TaxID=48709 RepID=A0A1D2NE14_ORCCI|nr:hypothetical protein Ocin01_03164 [Orchesella cincta]